MTQLRDQRGHELFPLTQSPAAWQAALPLMDIVARPAVEQLLAKARPDERGLVTLHMNEWLFTQAALASDDALWDRLEEDQVV